MCVINSEHHIEVLLYWSTKCNPRRKANTCVIDPNKQQWDSVSLAHNAQAKETGRVEDYSVSDYPCFLMQANEPKTVLLLSVTDAWTTTMCTHQFMREPMFTDASDCSEHYLTCITYPKLCCRESFPLMVMTLYNGSGCPSRTMHPFHIPKTAQDCLRKFDK